MSKKSKKKEDKKVLSLEEKIIIAREKRRLIHESSLAKKIQSEDSREEFRKFFIKIKSKLNLDKDMEEVLWLHLKSSGFDKKELFEKGIKHFGYKL